MPPHRGLDRAARIRDGHGVHIEELNLGGGFGIAYTPDDDPADIKVIAQSLHQIVAAQCAAAGLEVPRLTVEPGRAIAGPGTETARRGAAGELEIMPRSASDVGAR